MSKEAEKEVKISPRKLRKIKKALAEFEALKKALKEDPEWKKYDNPGVSNFDLLLFMNIGFSDLRDEISSVSNKLSYLLGATATAVALLIALAVAVF